MKWLGLVVLFVTFAVMIYAPQYWALYFCFGVSVAAACFSLAAGAARKALKEREVRALEEMARQGQHRP